MLQALNMIYIEKCQRTDERHAHMHDCACILNMSSGGAPFIKT